MIELITCVALIIIIIISLTKFKYHGTAVVIERFGKYYKTVSNKPFFIIPFIDRIKAIVNIGEQTVDIPPCIILSADNVRLSIDATVFLKVENVQKAVYEISNLKLEIEQMTVSIIRSIVESMKMRDVITSRCGIQKKTIESMNEIVSNHGICIREVIIKNIILPKDVYDTLKKEATNKMVENSNNEINIEKIKSSISYGIHKETYKQDIETNTGFLYEFNYSISYMITNVNDVIESIIRNQSDISTIINSSVQMGISNFDDDDMKNTSKLNDTLEKILKKKLGEIKIDYLSLYIHKPVRVKR